MLEGAGEQAVEGRVTCDPTPVSHRQALSAHLEPGPVGGERIVPARPVLAWFLRHRRIRIVLAIVEDDLQKPFGWEWDGRLVLCKNRVIGRDLSQISFAHDLRYDLSSHP
jgi:hypothetical protein